MKVMEKTLLKLYGFPSSNYVNMVQLALLEKDVPFEFVLTYPNQSPELFAKSPRGKVPFTLFACVGAPSNTNGCKFARAA